MLTGPEPRFGVIPTGALIDAATLAMLLDHAYDAVAVRRPTGEILYWNRGAERTFGWTTGIGLTLVRSIVDLHGGTVIAESQGNDQGSTFRVRLPRVQQGTREAEATPSPSAETAVSKRVLIADDNLDAAESLQLWLQLAGHDVQIAGNGVTALKVAEAFKPDVALLDLGMPGLSGFDVARRIRESPWGSRIVLVALTGWGQDEDRRQSAEAGFDHHVTKPIAPEAIESLIGSL
jgi:CheY-like chemotaxis protein